MASCVLLRTENPVRTEVQQVGCRLAIATPKPVLSGYEMAITMYDIKEPRFFTHFSIERTNVQHSCPRFQHLKERSRALLNGVSAGEQSIWQ